jgi:hypothetical protein
MLVYSVVGAFRVHIVGSFVGTFVEDSLVGEFVLLLLG